MLKQCARPGCTELIERGNYCDRHKRHRFDLRAIEQKSSSARGYDRRWEKYSREYLIQHPWCAECLRRGEHTPAEVVDHIIPHKGDRALFWAVENHQPLCVKCHTRKTLQEMRQPQDNGLFWPTLRRPAIPVTVVCGPPGSGKTTYAHDHAGPRDIIIDVDEIISELSGQPVHRADLRAWLRSAMMERNRRLAALADDGEHDRAWFVVSAARYTDRCRWADTLNADIVLLDVDAETCKRRIMLDEDRGVNRSTALRLVDKWHATATRGPRDGRPAEERASTPRVLKDFWGS